MLIDTSEKLPDKSLRPYISHYAGFRIMGASLGITRTLPSRHVTLMIGLGTPFIIENKGTFTSFLCGMADGPNYVHRGKIIEGVHIFLNPLGVYALLGLPASAFAGQVVNLSDIIGSSAHELHDRLQEDLPWSSRFGILDNMFIRILKEASLSNELIWSWKKLLKSSGNIRISELSEEIDDISNLLTSLVSSAIKTVSIVSPFTNKAGLNSVLAPLKSCKNLPSNSIYLTADTLDQEMIYKQIIKLIPSKMLEHLRIYFCTSEEMDGDYLPHAKLLIVDSIKGYLGSANFTKQGLTSRFEVGVELDEQQSKTVEKLLRMLVEKGVFTLYSPS